MRDSDIKTNCRFSEEVIAYIYDELSPGDRDEFDSHLIDCSDCIEELAAVSLSHYSVHEWRTIEFEPLATPVFEIPQSYSIADRIRAVFASARWLTATSAVAATVILAFVGIYLLSDQNAADEFAAVANDNRKPAVKITPGSNTTIDRRDVVTPATANPEPIIDPAKRVTNGGTEIERGEPAVQPKAVKANVPANVPRKDNSRQNQNRSVPDSNPRLNDFDDEEDDTLRLGDIFDDIDTLD